jgi:Zn-dependent oligopeptidase
LYPDVKKMLSTSFSHIFQGGYSAGYTATNGPKFSMQMLLNFQEKGFSIKK